MICDIIERVNIKKVDKCLASDLHIDPAYIILHPNTERLLCHTMHIRGPRYTKSFYAIDMIWYMATKPSRTRHLWSEFISEMRRK